MSSDLRNQSAVRSGATWFAMLLLLHPLSIGPAAYLQGREVLHPAIVDLFYRPEIRLINHFASVEGPLWVYAIGPYSDYVFVCLRTGERHGPFW